ncbi:hypothetical protein QT986_28145 [Microcoleus sp. herbarium14]
MDDYDIEPYRKSVTCAQQKSTTEVKMEANNVDATVDFVDFGVRKQDSATGEGQSDAKPGIENETLLHTLRASSTSAVQNKEVLPQKSQEDATVDFVDISALKQDSAASEGQSDAQPGIENQTLLHTLRASSKSAVENKQVLPEFTRS